MRIFSDSVTDGARKSASDTAYLRDRIHLNLAGVGAMLALASAKGGVGKSMLAVNIAAALALKGRKVAIFDADLNSPSIAAMLGIKPPRHLPMIEGIEPASGPHGLRFVSSELVPGGEPEPINFTDSDGDFDAPAAKNHAVELSYFEALQRILAHTRFGNLDLLIIDLAPGLDRLHTVAAMLPLDVILLLSHPSAHAARAARHAVEIANGTGSAVVRLVENMVGFNCDGCRAVRPLWPQGDLHGVARDSQAPIIARLAFEPRVADSTDRGILFVREYAATPTGKSLADLAGQVETIFSARVRPAEIPATES